MLLGIALAVGARSTSGGEGGESRTLTVYGFATTAVNGVYTEDGEANGHPKFVAPSGCYVEWYVDWGVWRIHTADNEPQYYLDAFAAEWPWDGTPEQWQLVSGSLPTGEVVEGEYTPPPSGPPIMVSPPYITGPNDPPQVGDFLTWNHGIYDRPVDNYAIVWPGSGGELTSPTVEVGEEAVGTSFTVLETASNAFGSSDQVSSAPTAIVVVAP